MKLLINSEDCVINNDLEYIIRPNINTEKYNYCQLLHISTTSKINNVNKYYNKFIITLKIRYQSFTREDWIISRERLIY